MTISAPELSPSPRSPRHWLSAISEGFGYAVTATLALILLLLIVPLSHSYPYSDDWDYLPPMLSQGPGFLHWLFIQHVDHRIPIQRLLHFATLSVAGYDFRAVIAVNVIVATAICVMLIRIARRYRGSPSVGDAFIPVCILNMSAGFAQWGFEFQFLSSIFFVTAFVYFVSESSIRGNSRNPGWLAIAALFLCAWCGLNGVILSSILSATLLCYLMFNGSRVREPVSVALIVCILTNLILIAAWAPSSASTGKTTVAGVTDFIYGMINSPLIVYAYPHSGAKFAVLGSLVLAGLIVGAIRLAKRRPASLLEFAVTAALAATSALIVATAAGRSSHAAWSPGLEMHYGVLATLLPTTAWILVSANSGRVVSTVIGFGLLALFGSAYWANADWRLTYIASSRSVVDAASGAILSTEAANSVAEKYIKQYYFVDSPDSRQKVEHGIALLRRRAGQPAN